jgi:predicted nuclease with TOPRIM domain
MKDFNVALDLLRHGNDSMMRDMHPDLAPVFDLIEELREKLNLALNEKEDLEDEVARLEEEVNRLQDELGLYK